MNFIYILSAAEGKEAPVIGVPPAPSTALALGGLSLRKPFCDCSSPASISEAAISRVR